jgi:hypothetical protein
MESLLCNIQSMMTMIVMTGSLSATSLDYRAMESSLVEPCPSAPGQPAESSRPVPPHSPTQSMLRRQRAKQTCKRLWQMGTMAADKGNGGTPRETDPPALGRADVVGVTFNADSCYNFGSAWDTPAVYQESGAVDPENLIPGGTPMAKPQGETSVRECGHNAIPCSRPQMPSGGSESYASDDTFQCSAEPQSEVQEDESDWNFLERQLDLVDAMREHFASLRVSAEEREEVLDDLSESGMAAIQASIKSSRGNLLLYPHFHRLRVALRKRIANMIPQT